MKLRAKAIDQVKPAVFAAKTAAHGRLARRQMPLSKDFWVPLAEQMVEIGRHQKSAGPSGHADLTVAGTEQPWVIESRSS